MARERTFSILNPDATARNLTEPSALTKSRLESSRKRVQMTRERPYFKGVHRDAHSSANVEF